MWRLPFVRVECGWAGRGALEYAEEGERGKLVCWGVAGGVLGSAYR